MGSKKSADPSLHPPLHGYQDAEASPEATSWVLLDLNAYIADRQNSTSACAVTSTGVALRVTFCTAPAPLVSYICVWCPGLQNTEMLDMASTTIEAAESDLLLLRVAVSNHKADYFIYKANGGNDDGAPSLRLIEIPGRCRTHRYTIALLADRDVTSLPSHGDDDIAAPYGERLHGEGSGAGLTSLRAHGPVGAGSRPIPYMDGEVLRFRPRVDDSSDYYLATIIYESSSSVCTNYSFWLFDSKKGEKWSRLPFSLHGDMPYHITKKAIVLRQDGLVGFVDPLRGIIICDVLCHETPRYLPLPQEAILRKDIWNDPLLFRDVAVVGGRLTLVQLRRITKPGTTLSCRWAWEVSTWSRMVTPHWDEDWRKGYTVQSGDISVDEDTENFTLLPELKDSEGVLRPSLERFFTAHPVLSLSDKRVVYIMGKVGRQDDKAFVLSIDMMRRRLQGVAMFDAERMVGVTFNYSYTQSRIPGYLNAGVKRKQKRPGMFRKLPDRNDEEYDDAVYSQMHLSGSVEEQQDTGASKGAEHQDNSMDLD